jgi:hypothetical protein
MTMTRDRRQPVFDIHPVTGASIEVFYAEGLATSAGATLAGSGTSGGAVLRPMARRTGRFRRVTQRIAPF